jgi:3-hydroxyacyl-CoA dehydrogenase/enoyl-CoA hydratase/3-hydroxybutyryl-CoA epimerase
MTSPRLHIDAHGIAWITFDDTDSKVNVISSTSMGELDRIADTLWNRHPKGVVLISAKPNIFIAGANIQELAGIRDARHAEELSRAGHHVFNKIEELGVPTVAAIDGACLGGGLELALACRYRVATDNPKTIVGLPETQLGIIPGWGGTQRLPRLVGLKTALDLILPGKTLDAVRANRIGLVDDVVPPVLLRDRAAAVALGRITPRRRAFFISNKWPARNIVAGLARRAVMARTRGLYAAPLKALDAAVTGLDLNLHHGALELEARLFSEVAATSQSRNLVRVFFLREKHAKLTLPVPAESKSKLPVIRKVGVIGAGVMGAGIAQWCAARGFVVRLKDINPEYVAGGIKRIAAVFEEGVKRRKLTALQAAQGMARVHPTTDDTGFDTCDLVIEAVLENIEVKRKVFAALQPLLKRHGVLASNTSAIPIDQLAAASGNPDRFVGLHFFNPVHRMPLVEIVRGEKTSPETLAAAVEFAKQLKKIPVIVKGTPGFLVNRLLMPYLNEAGRLLEEGVALETIDNAMLAYGWPMGPLRLIDEIGIDVAFDVGTELAGAFPDRMQLAGILRKLHEAGLKGRKGGEGFYVFKGKKTAPNPRLRAWLGETALTMANEPLQHRLMNVMYQEAKRCLDERVVETEDDIDAAMIFGTGYPPFRGGLMWSHAHPAAT